MENSINKKRAYSNILLIIMAESISLFGTSIYNFAVSLYVLKITGSGRMFALIMIVSVIPKVVFGIFAGSIADRYERKVILIGSDAVCGITVLLLFVFSQIRGLSLIPIFITAVVLSFAGTFYTTALQSSIPDIVDDSNLVKINTFSQAVTSLSQVMGPFIGGIIYAFVDMKLFLFINAVSFVMSAVFEVFIDFKINKSNAEKLDETVKNKGFKCGFMEGLKYIKGSRLITILMFFSVFLNFIIVFGMTIPFPYIVNNIEKFPSSWYGTIESMISFGIIAASIIISIIHENKKKYRQMIFGLLLCGICICLISLPGLNIMSKTGIFIFYMIVMIILGFAVALVDVPVDLLLQRNIPENMRGRVMGDLNVLSTIIVPIAMMFSGLLVDAVSPFILPVVSGIAMMIVTFFMSVNKTIKAV